MRRKPMELLIALVLFISLVATWIVLPGGTGVPIEVETVGSAIAEPA
jgi:hypothetical protein